MAPTIRRLILASGCLLLFAGCRPSPPPAPVADVLVTPVASLPADPSDAAWNQSPEYVAQLIPQDLVEPRQLQPSTDQVRVRALTDGNHVAFRLEWKDDSPDDLPGPADFSDACAVQLPARAEPTVPAPQMGEPGRPVEITFWTAAWQAVVDGRGETLRDLYPNATVDHYPYQAEPLRKDAAAQREFEVRYSPAQAAGNIMSGAHDKPVQDLIAEGPGTLSPASTSDSQGCGRHAGDVWAVVISRPLPAGLTPDQASQIAFAVWEGSHDEVGSRKMRTGWINLLLQAEAQ